MTEIDSPQRGSAGVKGNSQAVTLPHDHGNDINNVIRNMPDSEECAGVADMFKQVGDATRLRIFMLLCHYEECVSNIAAIMGMTDPAVSHHLKVLKNSNLIVGRRDGREVYYRISDSEHAALLHHSCDAMFRIACPNENHRK